MTTKLKLRIFSVFTIILLCISVTIKTLQNDTFYIIKLGEDILRNGIDLMDHYSWIPNLSYTYPHWLYDVLMYIIYDNFNYLGVYISTMCLFIVLILSIYIINLKVNKNELLASIVAIVSIPCLSGFATARSQLVTGILFLWQIYIIEELVKTSKFRYVFLLTVISWLVANLHATIWIFYFILYLPFLGHMVVYWLLNKKLKVDIKNNKLIIEELKNFKLLFLSMVLGFFMGFFTPSKICFTYIFKVMMGNSQDYIIEHAPMVLINNIPFLCFIIVLLVMLIFSSTKIKLKDFFLIFGLIFMSLCSFRHVALFYIIGLLYVSVLANRYFRDNGDVTLNKLGYIFVNNKVIYVLSFVLIGILSFSKFQTNFAVDYVPKDIYPVDAVKYIKKNLDVDNIRLYNNYDIGSYLLFNDISVFVDSRCDLYLKEFNGLEYSIFDDEMNMIKNYEEKFQFYDFTHALVIKDSLLNKFLIKDNKFKSLYQDKYFELFEVVVDE